MSPGRFIVFEGTEGSGKSTQVRLLGERMRAAGLPVDVTREPGGTPAGEAIRTLLFSEAGAGAAPRTVALLHTAARAEHVARRIEPAVASGTHVLCDRFLDSTLAYQGGGSGLPIDELLELQSFAVGNCEPDLRVLIAVDVEVGLQRRFGVDEEVNWIDRAGLDFHSRVQAVFQDRARTYPTQWLVVDGDQPATAVSEEIVLGLRRLFPEFAGL
ncbi:MAG: dTMP kinase [Thermomicrobiales bacterium]|nr:dTMP kinase [Thermomicrobiales bacterium]